MFPLDDRLPAEMDAQNEEMVAFLRQSHDKADIIAAEPEAQYKALGLAAVRQRLLAAQRAQDAEEQAQPAPIRLLMPEQVIQTPDFFVELEAKTTYKRRWRRGISLLTAALCVAMLVGSMLTVFGLLKRNASTQVSTAAGAQALYVVTTGWLQKIDAASGLQIWRVPLPYQKGSYDIPMNFPLVGNGIVYVTADNTLFAFHTSDGHQLWSVKLNDGSVDEGGQLVQPVLADGRLYYGLQQNASNSNQISFHIDVFDASSGRVLWHYQPAGLIEEMVVNHNTLYMALEKFIPSGQPATSAENDLIALNAVNGAQKWSVRTRASHVSTAGILNGDSLMVVNNGIIYQILSSAACDGKNGSCLFAWRTDTGTLLWHSHDLITTLSAQTENTFWFEGSLLAAGNALYIDSNHGLFALDAHNGQLLWSQPEGSFLTSKPANQPLSQPFAGKGNPGNAFVMEGDHIYLIEMTDQGNYLATLNTSDGKVVARQRVERFYGSLTAQVVLDTKQYTGSLMFEGLMTETTSYVFPSVGQLDALDNRTGKQLWSIHLAGNSSAVLTQAR